MKKFLLGILLPVLTLVTLIGTGFATWYFSDSMSTSAKNDLNTVEVTGYATVGKIAITSPAATTITLDQPKTDVDGITLDNAITATYTPESGADNTKPGKFVCTVEIPKDLAVYVELTTGWTKSGDSVSSNVTYTKETAFNGGNTLTTTIKTDDFKYVQAKVPTKVSDYNTMVGAVKGKTITVTFTATLNPKTA